MRTKTVAVGVVASLLLLGGGAAAVAVGANPLAGGEEDGVEEAELAGFERTQPFCVDERPTNSSTEARSIPGGEQLVVNDTIAVASPDSDVRADLRTIGPDRHVLALSRERGDAAADCDLAIRYEATVNLSTDVGYTLLVTYDRELVASFWSEPGAAGGSRSAGGAEARPGTDAASSSSASDGASGGASASGSADASSASESDA